MKKILLIILCVYTSLLNAQNFQWAKSFGGIESDNSFSITTDSHRNVYTTGSFRGVVDFDPGVGVYNLTSVGSDDVFIQKLDSAGNFLWAKSFGGIAIDKSNSITNDSSGNIYISGSFMDTVDFDPDTGIYNLSSIGAEDVFILKVNTSGNFLWAKTFGGLWIDVAYSITIDIAGNVYSTGFFSDIVDFDPSTAVYNSSVEGLYDIFVHKMDSTGNFLWVRTLGGFETDIGNSIATDAWGNVYTVGQFEDVADFDPGPNNLYSFSEGFYDIFIHKMDSIGNLIWVKTFGDASSDYGKSITIDNAGEIYITGIYTGTLNFFPSAGNSTITSVGGYDTFIIKMANPGFYLWARSLGGINAICLSNDIEADSTGNIYITGSFNGTVDFDPGTATLNDSSAGSYDIFILKMDALGNFVWTKNIGGTNNEIGTSVIVDNEGNVYGSGFFEGIVDFDPGAGVFYLNSSGLSDVFILKLGQSVTNLLPIANTNISIYPNPTTGTAFISLAQITNYVTLTITDILGKEIFSQTYNNFTHTNIEIDGKPGFYFLTIKTPEGNNTFKLLKE